MALSPTEVYAVVNDRVLKALDKGIVPWQKPWTTGANMNYPRNLQSGKFYRGINVFLLGMQEYSDPRWTTFAAAKKMGGKVIKGEHSTLVTLMKRIQVKDPDAPNGKRTIPLLRYYRVFNVEQVIWPEGTIKPLATDEPTEDFDPIGAGEDALQRYVDSDSELSLRWGGNRASYTPALHLINLPDRESFRSPEGFYATAFHECAHSTSRPLKRKLDATFGSTPYAKEELIAEMAAAFVCGFLSIQVDYEQTAAYIANWKRAIQDDPKILVSSAGAAQRASDCILGITFDKE